MLIPSLILLFLFSLLSAFVSSSKTAFAALHKPAISYLIDNKEINIDSLLRDPLFAPESVPMERGMCEIEDWATLIP